MGRSERVRSLLLRVLAVVLALGAFTPATAQITSGSVAGAVRDAQGGAVPGATVVLISEQRGIRLAPVVTGGTGDFSFQNVAADTYTVEVTMSGFKTFRRTGVAVSPGDRLAIGVLTIDVGGTTEVVTVTAADQALAIQAASGERSFTVTSSQIDNLPVGRTFQQFAGLTPGVTGVDRLGGGGGNNYMMDGVVVMDPGNGGPAMQVNTETIAEIKVLTSGYQAEYGRAAGLQITAVTKSGTNQFRGSVYDVERRSSWNPNSRVNILNGDPKSVSQQRDFGFSIGGPVGKPGGENTLFFFYAQEWNPRSIGGNVVRFRMPTALERAGDFSQTLDQNGAPYPYIKDPAKAGVCSAADPSACFNDGGVLGKIPASQLYGPGLAILNWWPMPTIENAAGLGYNYEKVRPVEKALGYQPVVKMDYQPSPGLRIGGKFAAYGQRPQTFLGTIPGFTDSRPSWMVTPSVMATASYAINNTTFLEGTFGTSWYQQEGCAFTSTTGNLGPSFCTNSIAQSPLSNYQTAGFGDLPLLFPDAQVIDRSYNYIKVLDGMNAPMWDGTRLWRAPTFAFGNRVANAPPGTPFPGYFQAGGTRDLSISVTKTMGRHTLKAGYYYQYELHFRNGGTGGQNGTLSFAQDTVGLNPFDTSFGYANAAIGTFSSFTQISKFMEGKFIYHQNDFYVQDNWKVNSRLTLDYGVRFVNQRPYYDQRRQASNFFPDRWTLAAAPALYVAGCANGVTPCSGTNRQAQNPITGEFLGANSALAIGTMVPGTGSLMNGSVAWGDGIAGTGYKWPVLAAAPRFGVAYDLTGEQNIVLRGGVGLFYDRPSANAAGTYAFLGGPPFSDTATVRYGQLQTLGTAGLTTNAPPTINAHQYDAPLPASVQGNAGVQMVLPWSTTLDVSYAGQHSYNTIQSVNVNALDIGAAFRPSNQDPTAPPNATPGAASLVATNPSVVRPFPGYGAINMREYSGWRTFHSLQVSFNRRFSNGFSFGLNDTISLYDWQSVAPRFEHPAPGVYQLRSDEAAYQALLGNNRPPRHILKGNFVWDLPDLRSDQPVWRAIGYLANDWQLSGVWSGSTSTPYTIGYSYASGGGNLNLTGSPDYGARIRLLPGQDLGGGCNGSDTYRQFNTAAFAGPLTGSDGLESGSNYLRGCFVHTLDLAVARNIRLGGGRVLQVRLDMFNAPNSAIITGRNTTMQLTNPTDPTTITNLPFDASGTLLPNRSRPANAGFGVANSYQAPRSMQLQVRFSF